MSETATANTKFSDLSEWMSIHDGNMPTFFLKGVSVPMQLTLSHHLTDEGTMSVSMAWVESIDHGGHMKRLEQDDVKHDVIETIEDEDDRIAIKDDVMDKMITVLSNASGVKFSHNDVEEDVWEADNPFAVAMGVNGLDADATVGEVYEKFKKGLELLNFALDPEDEDYVLSALAIAFR